VDLPELSGITVPVTIGQVIAPGEASFELDTSAALALYQFVLERLRYVLEQRGFDARNVRAVTHQHVTDIAPLTARRKLEVLPEFTESADFRQLATAFKRVRNIAREMPADDATLLADATSSDLRPRLREPAELALFDEIQQRQQTIEAAIAAADFRRAFAEAARFGPAVDRFFTEVFVMVDDATLKLARLQLMKGLETLILELADVSEIVAESSSRS
jgi:glycyl-tRNA synthetase beta chain